MQLPRPEYPRPQFQREQWLNLNGNWLFDFDDANVGLAAGWHNKPSLKQEINVPFAFQSKLSGIHSNEMHDIVWYQRDFEIPASWQGQFITLHFGAVDFKAWVWVNGCFAVFHEGGHTPFQADITPFLLETTNSLVVRVEDNSTDLQQPRGKQYWERESASIYYSRTTGIWQTVWLEPVQDIYLNDLHMTPDIDTGTVRFDYVLSGGSDGHVLVETEVFYNGSLVSGGEHNPQTKQWTQTFNLSHQLHLWSPESPELYDVIIRIKQAGKVLDEVKSYLGMRKISIQDGKICLNNQPYIMKLVLDQGYHPEGLLSFPSDDNFIRDIELTKAMGFNGVRKHQKVEDPRYLYWADQLGLLVWAEMANAFVFSPAYIQHICREWQQVISRDYNHPCIIVWVPMNESWGVPDLKNDSRQRNHLTSLYHLTKSLDDTRLVVSNDGWEHAKTDLLTIHDYESDGDVLRTRYSSLTNTLAARPARRTLFVAGYEHRGEPVLLTEFGGVALRKSQQDGWGYSTAVDETEFTRSFREIVEAVQSSPILQGYCYTQLTDVEQEINGLLTYDRQAKIDVTKIAKINQGEAESLTG